MKSGSHNIRQALKRLPVPDPRPEFVDRALARAVAANTLAVVRTSGPHGVLRRLALSWQTWVGAALGGVAAALVMLMVLRPVDQAATGAPGIALVLHEARDIDVMIDSERALEGATIRIEASGSVALNGYDNDREIGWRTDLERGGNLLSLPIVARSTGQGRLVAIIEHEGRTRRLMINITVLESGVSQS